MLPLYSAPHTRTSPLSSCLIKTLTVAARAVIHVIAEDNPVISQWCLMPGTMLFLTVSQMDQFIYVKLKIVLQSRESDLVPESTVKPGDEILMHGIRIQNCFQSKMLSLSVLCTKHTKLIEIQKGC